VKIDTEVIRELAELLTETGLTEIEWSEGEIRVRVARGPAGAILQAPGPRAADTAPAAAPTAAASDDDVSGHPGVVVSPMVGTVYLQPEPDAARFVQVGSEVAEGQTLLIVEAMKTMNPIPCPRAGTITRILVEDQQPVEFGQALMLIE